MENYKIIYDTVEFFRVNGKRVFVNLEHYFDGYVPQWDKINDLLLYDIEK